MKECKLDDIGDVGQAIVPSKNTITGICQRLDALLKTFEKCGITDTDTNYGW